MKQQYYKNMQPKSVPYKKKYGEILTRTDASAGSSQRGAAARRTNAQPFETCPKSTMSVRKQTLQGHTWGRNGGIRSVWRSLKNQPSELDSLRQFRPKWGIQKTLYFLTKTYDLGVSGSVFGEILLVFAVFCASTKSTKKLISGCAPNVTIFDAGATCVHFALRTQCFRGECVISMKIVISKKPSNSLHFR